MVTKYKVSPSGFYKVGLARVFPHAGFDYKPGHAHTVNQEILDAMIAGEVVTDVASA
jgi:hypothetical protein